MDDQLKIFVSYSHEDKEDKNQLLKYLRLLQKSYDNIMPFSDDLIVPGDKWDDSIVTALKESHIIILLLSVDFLVSEYINNVELEIANKMADNQQAQIIPIYIKKCQLDAFPRLKQYQSLPEGITPVEAFTLKTDAWDQIYTGLKKAIEKALENKSYIKEAQIIDEENKFHGSTLEEFDNKNKIFLATSSENLSGNRSYLYADLMGKFKSLNLPYEIVPNPEDSLKLESLSLIEQEEKIGELLDQSFYSIHLFDSAEQSNTPLIYTQYNLAQKKCSCSEFKCIVSLNSNALDKPLIDRIEKDRLKNPNIVRLTDKSLLEIKAAVLTQIEKYNSIRIKLSKRAKAKKSVFILCHQEDFNQDPANQLLNKIITELENKHNMVVIEPVLEDNLEAIEHEKKQLVESDAAIVFYGYGNRNWWAKKKTKIVKADHLISKAVCFNDPDKENKITYVSKDLFIHLNNSDKIESDLEKFANGLQ